MIWSCTVVCYQTEGLASCSLNFVGNNVKLWVCDEILLCHDMSDLTIATMETLQINKQFYKALGDIIAKLYEN